MQYNISCKIKREKREESKEKKRQRSYVCDGSTSRCKTVDYIAKTLSLIHFSSDLRDGYTYRT